MIELNFVLRYEDSDRDKALEKAEELSQGNPLADVYVYALDLSRSGVIKSKERLYPCQYSGG